MCDFPQQLLPLPVKYLLEPLVKLVLNKRNVLERVVGPDRARELFAAFPGLTLWDDPSQNRYPMPISVEGQDDCYVGRVRQDLSLPNAINFWVVGDQLRKGAALTGVQVAELLIR